MRRPERQHWRREKGKVPCAISRPFQPPVTGVEDGNQSTLRCKDETHPPSKRPCRGCNSMAQKRRSWRPLGPLLSGTRTLLTPVARESERRAQSKLELSALTVISEMNPVGLWLCFVVQTHGFPRLIGIRGPDDKESLSQY